MEISMPELGDDALRVKPVEIERLQELVDDLLPTPEGDQPLH